MSLKSELETWAAALEAYDAQDFDAALERFAKIADNSKIMFNIALIHATLGEHQVAVDNYVQANQMDQFLAVSHFQRGVSNFLLGRYEDARTDFDEAHIYLRENSTIDYDQIGLKFRLYSCEVLFNRGLAAIYMGQDDLGLADFEFARQQKQTDEHGVIDDAIVDRGDGYTVFSIPVGVVYRPPPKKLENLKSKNYLGQAKVVAATDSRDLFSGFSGAEKKKLADQKERERDLALVPLPVKSKLPIADAMSSSAPQMTRSNTAAGRLDGPMPSPVLARVGATALRRSPSDIGAINTALPPLNANRPQSPISPLNRYTPMRKQSLPLSRSNSANSSAPAFGANSPLLPPAPAMARSKTTTAASPPRLPYQPESTGGLFTPPDSNTSKPERGVSELYDDYASYSAELDQVPQPQESSLEELSAPARRPSKETSTPPPPQPLPRVPQGQAPDRVADWARRNAASSRRPPPAALSGKSISPSSGPQKGSPGLQRSKTLGAATSPVTSKSRYEDEEEGYGSGFEDTNSTVRSVELVRVRVKLYWGEETRGMSIIPSLSHADFLSQVLKKFKIDRVLLKYRDEDGELISIEDESDWDSAMDAAKENGRGRPEGKLQIWVAAE